MSESRSGHTATLLPNGTVLVAGGCDDINCTVRRSSAELFDAAAAGGVGAFAPAPPLPVAHAGHTATLLPSGKLFVAGGQGVGLSALATSAVYDSSGPGAIGAFTAGATMSAARVQVTVTMLASGRALVVSGTTAELYAAQTDSFAPTGTLGFNRTEHTATLLASGKVLITGGWSQPPRAETEVWDPTAAAGAGAFARSGDLIQGRNEHRATLLPSGRVLVTGGRSFDQYLTSAEVWDPATGACTATGPMLHARSGHVAVLLPSGKVLVAGGGNSSAELYDPATGVFTALPDMTTGRVLGTETLLADGRVLIAGGGVASAEVFDPVSGTFTSTGSMSISRMWHTATLLPSGRVLITGGNDESESQSSAELWSTTS